MGDSAKDRRTGQDAECISLLCMTGMLCGVMDFVPDTIVHVSLGYFHGVSACAHVCACVCVCVYMHMALLALGPKTLICVHTTTIA